MTVGWLGAVFERVLAVFTRVILIRLCMVWGTNRRNNRKKVPYIICILMLLRLVTIVFHLVSFSVVNYLLVCN